MKTCQKLQFNFADDTVGFILQQYSGVQTVTQRWHSESNSAVSLATRVQLCRLNNIEESFKIFNCFLFLFEDNQAKKSHERTTVQPCGVVWKRGFTYVHCIKRSYCTSNVKYQVQSHMQNTSWCKVKGCLWWEKNSKVKMLVRLSYN
jgi:hypothetical protein